jgi:hypothetical protein
MRDGLIVKMHFFLAIDAFFVVPSTGDTVGVAFERKALGFMVVLLSVVRGRTPKRDAPPVLPKGIGL